jgi:hypothetical protein
VKGYIELLDKFFKYIKYRLNRFESDLFCFLLWCDGLKWSAIQENFFFRNIRTIIVTRHNILAKDQSVNF